MKKELRVLGVIVLGLLVGISATLSFAQQKQSAADRAASERERLKERQPAPDRDVRFEMEREMQGPEGMPPPPGMPGDFVFLATEMSFGGKVVKGAPYSAQAVTESTQTLSDGNRIVNKSTSAIYRDSEGRTRREQTLRAVGAFANGAEAPQIIFINDPVAGTSYTLDPRTHVARKMPPMNFRFQFKTPAPADEKGGAVIEAPPPDRVERGRTESARVEIERGEIGRAEFGFKAAPDTPFIWGWRNEVAKSESLGKQNVEGVEAEGTRSTVTIPAGEIGNERPIEIVNERWYSSELQTVVMTRHSDPRMGESSYRLTNIDRSEPAKSLFEVPADYTLKSGPAMAADSLGGSTGIGTTATYRPTGAITGGVLNGRATSLPVPPYPPIARAAHASGNVTVEVTIDEEGNVVAARAVSGHPLLQAASVAAARNAKFTPTKVSGQAVKVQGVLVYTFASEPAQSQKEND
jgi:TonB family protein